MMMMTKERKKNWMI